MIVEVEGHKFNTDGMKGMSEDDFRSTFAGKVKCDLTKAWRACKRYIEPPEQTPKRKKVTKKASK